MLQRVLAVSTSLLLLVGSAQAEGPLEYTSTGDALLDRYMAAVVARELESAQQTERWADALIAELGLEHLRGDREALEAAMDTVPETVIDGIEVQQIQSPEVLPLDLLRSWEPEFGNDVRYWQLLSWSARDQWSNLKDGSPHDVPLEQFEALVEAYERGLADGPTLTLLGQLFRYTDPAYVEEQLATQQKGIAETAAGEEYYGADFTRDELETLHVGAVGLATRLGMDQGALYDEAVRLNPDWAQMFYERAAYKLASDPHGAIADLALGNSAPVTRVVLAFPFSEVSRMVEQGQVPGTSRIFGQLSIGLGLGDTGRVMTLGIRSRAALKKLAAEDVPAAVDAFVHYFLREMLAEGSTPHLASLAAIGVKRLLREGVLEGDLPLSEEGRKGLQQALAKLGPVRDALKQSEQEMVDSFFAATDVDTSILTAEEQLAWNERFYGHYGDDHRRGWQQLTELYPQITDLAKIEYAALIAPQS